VEFSGVRSPKDTPLFPCRPCGRPADLLLHCARPHPGLHVQERFFLPTELFDISLLMPPILAEGHPRCNFIQFLYRYFDSLMAFHISQAPSLMQTRSPNSCDLFMGSPWFEFFQMRPSSPQFYLAPASQPGKTLTFWPLLFSQANLWSAMTDVTSCPPSPEGPLPPSFYLNALNRICFSAFVSLTLFRDTPLMLPRTCCTRVQFPLLGNS